MVRRVQDARLAVGSGFDASAEVEVRGEARPGFAREEESGEVAAATTARAGAGGGSGGGDRVDDARTYGPVAGLEGGDYLFVDGGLDYAAE